jgi:glycerol-3-phosphate O-acyltransferase
MLQVYEKKAVIYTQIRMRTVVVDENVATKLCQLESETRRTAATVNGSQKSAKSRAERYLALFKVALIREKLYDFTYEVVYGFDTSTTSARLRRLCAICQRCATMLTLIYL